MPSRRGQSVRQQRSGVRRAAADTGVSQMQMNEMLDIFGTDDVGFDKEDEDEDEDVDGEDEEGKRRGKRERGGAQRHKYTHQEKERHWLTVVDDKIRQRDVPERLQERSH